MTYWNRNEEAPSAIGRAIDSLARSTKVEYTAISQVNQAFLLGLWYKAFPDYAIENLDTLRTWDFNKLDPVVAESFIGPTGFKFQFISNTGDSWHQCYRDFRERGWKRLKVHREGGRLQYLLKIEDEGSWVHEGEADAHKVYDNPEGFRELTLLLDISISTCKQVQVGVETKEVPIMKTVCEDLVELPDTEGQVDSIVEINGETFVADIKTSTDNSGEAEASVVDDNPIEEIAAELFAKGLLPSTPADGIDGQRRRQIEAEAREVEAQEAPRDFKDDILF